MLKSVFHIGFMKTGSTFLQNSIFPKANSIFFPRHSNPEETYDFMNEIITIGELTYSYAHANRSFNELQLKSPGNLDTLVLSEELLTGDLLYPYTVSTKEYCHRLKDLDPDAKIIITTRNQPSMILALYKEYLQLGGTNHLSGFLKKEGVSQQKLLTDRLNYYYLVKYYEDVFGAENVHLACHEKLLDQASKIVLDILNFASNRNYQSLDLHGLGESDLELKINVGISQRFLGLARILNRYRKSRLNPGGIISTESWRILKAIDRRLNKLHTKTNEQSIPSIILDFSKKHFSESNALLAASHPQLELEKMGYPINKN